MAWVKPVPRTLSDQVAEAILERIARGELVPGSSLPPQRELSLKLGVGLSVVREAIQRGKSLTVRNVTKSVDIPVKHDLSPRQVQILLDGGLLNYIKKRQ